MNMIQRYGQGLARGAVSTLILASLAAVPGCGQGDGHNPAASPIVRPDSEPGKTAIAESETLFRLRREQEARARKRLRIAPGEG